MKGFTRVGELMMMKGRLEDGQTVVENKLVADAVSSPEVHTRNHSSEHAAIYR